MYTSIYLVYTSSLPHGHSLPYEHVLPHGHSPASLRPTGALRTHRLVGIPQLSPPHWCSLHTLSLHEDFLTLGGNIRLIIRHHSFNCYLALYSFRDFIQSSLAARGMYALLAPDSYGQYWGIRHFAIKQGYTGLARQEEFFYLWQLAPLTYKPCKK